MLLSGTRTKDASGEGSATIAEAAGAIGLTAWATPATRSPRHGVGEPWSEPTPTAVERAVGDGAV